MRVYRIALATYSKKLAASGRSARWNPEGYFFIYTSANPSLACLENVVHRSNIGLTDHFRIMTIEIPDGVRIEKADIKKLSRGWKNHLISDATKKFGKKWADEKRTCILQVPSAIVPFDFNYIINTAHPEFKKIKLISTQPFNFDARIKN